MSVYLGIEDTLSTRAIRKQVSAQIGKTPTLANMTHTHVTVSLKKTLRSLNLPRYLCFPGPAIEQPCRPRWSSSQLRLECSRPLLLNAHNKPAKMYRSRSRSILFRSSSCSQFSGTFLSSTYYAFSESVDNGARIYPATTPLYNAKPFTKHRWSKEAGCEAFTYSLTANLGPNIHQHSGSTSSSATGRLTLRFIRWCRLSRKML